MNRRRPSRAALVTAIVRKDLIEFSRDRLWVTLTGVALAMFVVLFWLMPTRVEEAIRVGITPAALAGTLQQLAGAEAEVGLAVIAFDDEASLRAAVAGEAAGLPSVQVGLALPDALVLRIATRQESNVRVYVDAAVPREVRGAMTSAVRELAFMLTGAPLPITLPAGDVIVLGEDRAGDQLPLRERLRPMLVFFVLITESLALASLIASEVGSRTVSAIVVTPARVADLLTAKGVTGTVLAFSQALLLLALTRSFVGNVPGLLLAVLLGAVLVAGIALLTGSAGRDFMGTLFLGVLFLIPLMIPSIALLFPGSASPWVQALPSYGVLQALVGAASYGRGLGDLLPYLAHAALWAVVVFSLGWWALARKVARA
jgi:ABC-2 type transport system permease protein